MTSRYSSGSRRDESAVEPTRSQNITVRCRRSALASDGESRDAVVSEKPEIAASSSVIVPSIGELVRSAIDLPAAEHVKGLVIHQQDAARRLAFGVAERADVDPIRTAMDGVGTSVPCAIGDLLRLDDLDDFRFPGVRLCVEDVNARGANTGHDQISALDMRMRHVRAQTGAARVPTEMMQLIARSGHLDATND